MDVDPVTQQFELAEIRTSFVVPVQSAISIIFFSPNGIKCTSYISWIDGNDKKKNLERIFN